MHASSLHHTRGQIGGLPGQEAELAGETAGSVRDHRRLGRINCGTAHHLDRALFDDNQVIGRIAGCERGLANLELVGAAIGA